MQGLTYEVMLKARLSRDPSYDGKFYVGIVSTGIYCLPSCKAKQASQENMLFFLSREEANEAGFRGCKRCKAEQFPNITPEWFEDVISYMKSNLHNKLDENRLIEIAQVDITTIRRHFKANLNISVMTYHRKLRLAHAKRLIDNGADYLTAAFESGFQSVSGFREAFIKEYGVTPAEGRRKI